ncbi:unnamed protein product [Periconia digitata]|uniref:CRIB domain-containing protein n=1 Tax=Periconia digitata TaxID=1303443 RepID=A0A9W4XJ77_9PLEO|nr:unnamed protein product [Periconia digitata]
MEIAGHIATAPYSRPVFVSHKKNALPESVQSSVDSLVTIDPSVSASPGSDASSYTDQPSPERHTGAHMAKRNSVFGLRNRSNTSNSTTSSSGPLNSSTTAGHDNASHRLSQDLRHLAGQSILEMNSAKRSIFRGKKGKRASGSFAPGSPPQPQEEADAILKRTSVLRKTKRPSLPSETSDLKPRISSPFDFKHLTHTDRHQFAALTGASENELVAGFQNISSSQTPCRDLTGIKVNDLRFRNLSAEGLVTSDANPLSPMSMKSPPMSAGFPQEEPMNFGSAEKPSRPPLRTARSVESFSRPGVTPRVHRHTQSANTNPPPPRGSSRLAMAPIDDLPEDSTEAIPTSSRRNSGAWNHQSPLSPQSPGGLLPSMIEESDYVGHALTTPDNSAIHPVTPPFSPGLDDVAEEPERFASPRPAPLPPVKTSLDNFSFTNPRSPVGKSHSRMVSFSTSPNTRPSMSRPMSQCSDTLGSSGAMPRRSSGRRMSVRRKSNTWRVMEESWEDDIDYIYDNALEADCDLEWDSTYADGTGDETSRDRTPERLEPKRTSDSSCYSTHASSIMPEEEPIPHDAPTGATRPSLVVPNATTVPELEMRSAVSASTIDTTGAEGFSLTPSLLIPQEYKEAMSHEDDYQDLIAEYESSDRHFPLLESARSTASSTRSSHMRSSKRSSYESSLVSSGPVSGSWASGARQSGSSSGSSSLPELVHSSRHARRDFNAVVDRLSHQVASINSFDEYDMEEREHDEDEATPPVHASHDRTFFTSDDEADERRGSVEADMKSSLELAQRGTARTPPSTNHKYASSQSVSGRPAQTLTRHRAASTANMHRRYRENMNSFPTPPAV